MRARATCARCKQERYLDHLRPVSTARRGVVVCKSESVCRTAA